MNFVMEWHEIISQKTQLTSQKIESRSELGRKKKELRGIDGTFEKEHHCFLPNFQMMNFVMEWHEIISRQNSINKPNKKENRLGEKKNG